MSGRHEAVSPPAAPPVANDTMLKVIEHGPAVVEVKCRTDDGEWSELFLGSRETVAESATRAAQEARRLEAEHRARAQAFEWVAQFVMGLG